MSDRGGIGAAMSVDRPVATFMVVAAVVVFGWVSLQQMPVDLMPELSYPTITVRTEFAGAAPEEVEDAVTRPIEEYLGTIEGLIGMNSVSRAGSSDVLFSFAWDTDLDVAIQKVRERIAVVQFPDGTEAPQILRYDPTLDPIVELAVVSSELSAGALRTYVVDEVERELEELPGVAMVRVTGGDEPIVRVALDEGRMATLGITPDEVANRLRAENINVAGGRLQEGDVEYLVRTVNEFTGIDDVASVIVAVRGAIPVRVSDLADVSLDVREREVLTRVDGEASVEIAVFKDADANLVAVADAVRQRLFGRPQNTEEDASGEPSTAEENPLAAMLRGAPPLSEVAPESVRFDILTDQSTYIRAAIAEVTSTAILGGLCAVLVLFIFLRRPFATAVIGLAIPLSVVATFAPLRLLDVSLNIMSLGGIALGIGMLVDNAIVVLEAIVRRRENGEGAREAAIQGTREVAGAVTASTMTTVAVFLPIVFVDGIAGQLFGDLGIAVVLSLIASLVFALLFVPMMSVLPDRLEGSEVSPSGLLGGGLRLASIPAFRSDWAWVRAPRAAWRWLYAVPVAGYILMRTAVWLVLEIPVRLMVGLLLAIALGLGFVGRGILQVAARVVDVPLRGFAWFLQRVTDAYMAGLRLALRARWVVLLIAGVAFAWSIQTWQTLGVQLIPDLSQGVFTAHLQLPVGTRIDDTAAMVARVEHALDGHPDIERIATFIGRDDEDLNASEQGEHTAELTVVVANAGEDPEAESRAMAAVRAAIVVEPALQHDISRPALFSLSDPIAVHIRGEDLDNLQQSATRVEAAMQGVPQVTDVRSSAREGFPEVRVQFDRERLAHFGLDVRTVAEAVRAKVQGAVATELRMGVERLDIEVALDRTAVADLATLESMTVAFIADNGAVDATTNAGLVAMPNVATGQRPVRLSSVATIEVGRGPAEIRRVEGQRAAVITAGSSVLDLGETLSALDAQLRDVRLTPGQLLVIGGQSEEMDAARQSLTFAMLLAVFLVYVVMASTFESLLGPLVILVTIPLALVGVVAALQWLQTPVSVVVLIGVIVLVGIVVNNAIVLVDYMIRLRRDGMAKRDAIVQACGVRLRPVLITASTTVLGLLPMALGMGEGAEIRRPLAWVVISGLAVGTILTLVVIPLVYDLSTRDRPARVVPQS